MQKTNSPGSGKSTNVGSNKSTEDLLLEGIGRTTAVQNETSFKIEHPTNGVDVIEPLPDMGEV